MSPYLQQKCTPLIGNLGLLEDSSGHSSGIRPELSWPILANGQQFLFVLDRDS